VLWGRLALTTLGIIMKATSIQNVHPLDVDMGTMHIPQVGSFDIVYHYFEGKRNNAYTIDLRFFGGDTLNLTGEDAFDKWLDKVVV
jgi:hypothetical protein